ncbi:MAG: choice-of-anchor P family protein [Mycobacteriales bacterium]|nr:MAG: hypothetical protein DLM56_12475 [Pseudonocardiales bacterium]
MYGHHRPRTSVRAIARRAGAGVAVGAVVAGGILASAGTASATTPTVTGFSNEAYGSYVNAVGGTIRSGPTALAEIACTTQAGLSKTNTDLGVNLAPVASFGVQNSGAYTYAVTGGSREMSTNSTATINLLSGLITADSVRTTVSAQIANGHGAVSITHTLVNLVVAGQSVAANVAPNTRLNLGFGYVIVNQENKTTSATRVNGTGRALDVVITSAVNPLGLGINSQIVVAYATGTLAAAIQGTFLGGAYGTYASVGSTVVSGQTALRSIPCLGGTSSNTIATVTTIPGVTVGAVTTNVAASATTAGSDAMAKNQIAGVNILSGVLTFDAITAVAHVNKAASANSATLDTTGSKFVNLHVLGLPAIDDNVAPNTTVTVPGVGSLTLYAVSKTNSAIRVTMVKLTLSVPLGGLLSGTTIIMGYAYAGIRQ